MMLLMILSYLMKNPKQTLNLKKMIMSEFKNLKIFLPRAIHQIGVKKSLLLKKIKNTVLWTYNISDLNDEEILGSFYEKELQKTDQKEFRIEKVIKKKGDKLLVKWKGYDNSFNISIDQKDLV